MRVAKPLVYANVAALILNVGLMWVYLIKTFPPILAAGVVGVFLLGSVWFSLKLNGLLPAKKVPFDMATTEKIRRV